MDLRIRPVSRDGLGGPSYKFDEPLDISHTPQTQSGGGPPTANNNNNNNNSRVFPFLH